MKDYKLCDSEARFADLVWKNEPINSGELVKLCEKEFKWKKSTTYTVLKKLCQREFFQNEGAVVSSLIKKSQYEELKSKQFVQSTFDGSLPKFLTAFIGSKKLSASEADELKKLIDEYEEG